MSIATIKRLIIICIFGLALVSFTGMHPAWAARGPNEVLATGLLLPPSCTLPVTVTTADELYDCITAANAGSGGTITLGTNIDLTTLTTSPLPQITSTITVEGAGFAIDGGNSVRIFDVGGTGDLTVNEATLQNGSADNGGAVLNNAGTLALTNSTLSGNQAEFDGGGVSSNGGTVTVNGSTFEGNSAGFYGGGMLNTGGMVTITGSTFRSNLAPAGGGISNGIGTAGGSSSILTLTGSTLSGNITTGSGGGIFNYSSSLTITNSTLSGNTSTLAGGGIYNVGTSAYPVTVTNSTFFDNDAGANNGGAAANDSGTFTLVNSLLTANSPNNCLAMSSSDASNIADDATCGSATQKTAGDINLDPTLADNGGPTFTHALLAGSQAIDFDASASCSGSPVNGVDQRGEPRNVDGDGAASANECDAGAYEFQPSATLTIAKETDPAGGTGFPFTIDPGATSFDFKWGTFGSANEQLYYPTGTAVDAAGNIYVADYNNARVQKLDSSGAFLFAFGWDVVVGGGTGFEICLPGDTCKAGTWGTGEGQFNLSTGVAIDAVGNIYVTDDYNHRIQKFDSSGAFLSKWGANGGDGTSGSGGGQFSYPWGVAVDDGGNVYVVDEGNRRIQKLDSSGAFLFAFGWDVVVGGGTGFEICTPSDTCKAGTQGTGNGQFNSPRGVAVDAAGNIYVADTSNHRIQKFNSSGGFLGKWGANGGDGTSGSGDGQYWNPYGVTVDAAGNVYVVDVNNNRIQKLNGNGSFLTQWGSLGSGDGQFKYPLDVAVDATGNVVVADSGNNRIQVFNPDLTTVLDDGKRDSFDLTPGTYLVSELVPYGWAVGQIDCGDGIVTGQTTTEVTLAAGDDITCTFSNVGPRLTIVKETSPAGGMDFPFTIDPGTYSFDFKWGANGGDGSSGSGDGEFDTPYGLAIDAAGNIYVADANNNRIQKFDSAGNFITKWGTAGSGDGQFFQPRGVAVDAAGNITVADTRNNRIQKFDSSGGFITKWGANGGDGTNGSGDGQFKLPTGVAIDAAGNIYVVDYGNNRVQKFGSSGGFITKWGTNGTGDGQFIMPFGLAIDMTGNVTVADSGNNRIQKFSSSGVFITKWGANGGDGTSGSGDGQFNLPFAVGLDAAGNVTVADGENNRIQKFDGDGGFLTKWGSAGSGDGQFQVPWGVAVGATGAVYVADTGNHRIQVFTPDLTTVLDDGQSDSFNLAPGDYTISELVPDGWTVGQIDCGDGIVTGQKTTEVTLAAGDDITCTFSNELVCPSSWTVATADELYACITLANENESPSPSADTITLAADIFLTSATSSPLPHIASQIMVEGEGYAIDGGSSMRIFYVDVIGDLTVNQAMLQNGSATYGGGIYNGGSLTVSSSTFISNTGAIGAGIFNTNGTATVTNSTFSGNDAAGLGSVGGGIMNTNNGILTVTNGTFFGNTAVESGSAIYAFSPSTVNFAGNIFAGGDNCDILGTLNDNGYNLSDDTTCTDGGPGSATNAALNLGPLSGGGPGQQVHIPAANSAAIGAVPNGITPIDNNGVMLACDGSTTDQLGTIRPPITGDDCDSGAVEGALMDINLASGWNMISANFKPLAPDMDAIFYQPLRDKLVLCKDELGGVYWPEFSINNIGNWDELSGYQCYMNESDTLSIYGTEINPEEMALALPAGWSLIAYLRDAPMPVAGALTTVLDEMVIIKNNAGQVFWPAYNVNQIGDMVPGEGYLIFLNNPDNLVYPAND